MSNRNLPFERDNFRPMETRYSQSGMNSTIYAPPQYVPEYEAVAYNTTQKVTYHVNDARGSYSYEEFMVFYGNCKLRQIRYLERIKLEKTIQNISKTLEARKLLQFDPKNLQHVHDFLLTTIKACAYESIDLAVVFLQDPSIPVIAEASKAVLYILSNLLPQGWGNTLVASCASTYPNDGRYLVFKLITGVR